MQLALRPYVTAGVALVGASVIAVTPVTAPSVTAPATQVSTASVALTAAVDPITRWVEVLGQTAANAAEFGGAIAADPAPILRQILANQLSYANQIGTSLSTAGEYLSNWATGQLPNLLEQLRTKLAQGDLTGAGNVVSTAIITLAMNMFPMLDIVKIPYQISQNMTAVLKAMTFQSFSNLGLVANLGMGAIAEVQIMTQFAFDTGQALVDAAKDGDPLAALSTIVNFPADFTGALLNGPWIPPFVIDGIEIVPGYFAQGLLRTLDTNPVYALLATVPRAIAAAITPPAATASLALPLEATAPETAGTELSLPEGAPTSIPGTAPVTLTGLESPTNGFPTSIAGVFAAAADSLAPKTVTLTPDTEIAAAEEPVSVTTVETPAADADSTVAPAEDADSGAAQGSSDGSTDLSDGNKATPGASPVKAKHRQVTRPNAALKTIGADVDKAVSKVADGVKKALGGKKKDAKANAGSDSGSSSSTSGGSTD
ncbi:hypothetical protein [Mycolicibacterium lutetiense]|uniref:PE-PGRS family protein n=1 Tax=Mycolicibacterium lutetiense TaxID=1641992 RepID=A0ABS5A0Z5_9MYCO|nr:hypothetical protein [Mycolicibacterium lutetiense]MBP2455417.1 hypothetical protein [Mycolicibacterium lutetiense]